MAIADSTPTPLAHRGDGALPIRTIDASDLNASLRDGLADFREKRGDLIFAGLLYPLIGLVTAWAALGGPMLYLLFPLAAGLSLLGPLVATGFYELAKRREERLESGWSHFLDTFRGPSVEALTAVAAMLIGVFVLWLLAAAAIYELCIGGTPPMQVGPFLTLLFTTPQGWTMMIVGDVVGALFAILVLAVSVVSLPMIVDRKVSAGAAVRTSLAAFRANRPILLRWGVTVGMLLALGSVPLFLGLAFVLPWLGYATWHLYTRLVDRGGAA